MITVKDLNKIKLELAEKHAAPHYENDETTWGAIDSSAFSAGFDAALPVAYNRIFDILKDHYANNVEAPFYSGKYFAEWLQQELNK